MPKIHPTAIVHPEARIADDVEIGPYCVIESDVEIGPGSVLREHVVIRRYVTMGKGNLVDAHTVLGGEPQDLKFDPETVTCLRIGDGNVFREGVTISRGTAANHATIVGDRTYWMAQSHAGHDAIIADEVILANGAAVGGHATIGRKVFLSAYVVVHQFVWVGEGVMSQGITGISAHIPPFTLVVDVNRIVGLNVVGMRRNPELTSEDRKQIKEAFRLTYRSGLAPSKALAEMDGCTDWGPAAGRFRDFIREVVTAEAPYDRGLCPMRKRN
ncbi:MAG: acyl-ACP--UDP-N-acetylglucosamine O-acyltransferase [Planctomycetota bacterium]|jgi:UDP-N-acetylglucosamine acyltransferase